MYKEVMALNNLRWLICCKIKSNQKCYIQNLFTNHIYLINMYEEDMVLNNLQWLIWRKTQPNKILYS